MANNLFPIGAKIGQTDRNGVEITVGSINENPDALPPLEICTYVPEAAAFLWLTPELHIAVNENGIAALNGHSLEMLMILSNQSEMVSINGNVATRPEVLSPVFSK